ncbi:hypothetical protein SETIT_1G353700v2 [Setaria italica]|uniref:Uncharacterized protein n=1 Tax=Setaria italica TaxID=4555 RepID=A0A368PSM4_SETIT|nr:hypothetical protein SETIT_1G353700v2 [Setaria italica]
MSEDWRHLNCPNSGDRLRPDQPRPFCFFFRGLIFPVVGSVRISSGILSAGDASASAGGRRARRHAAPVHASQVGGPRAGRQAGKQGVGMRSLPPRGLPGSKLCHGNTGPGETETRARPVEPGRRKGSAKARVNGLRQRQQPVGPTADTCGAAAVRAWRRGARRPDTRPPWAVAGSRHVRGGDSGTVGRGRLLAAVP